MQNMLTLLELAANDFLFHKFTSYLGFRNVSTNRKLAGISLLNTKGTILIYS